MAPRRPSLVHHLLGRTNLQHPCLVVTRGLELKQPGHNSLGSHGLVDPIGLTLLVRHHHEE